MRLIIAPTPDCSRPGPPEYFPLRRREQERANVVTRRKTASRTAVALGERIRARRDELKWTQQKLAEKAGFSDGYIRAVELGANAMTVPRLLRLAEALMVPAAELIAALPIDSTDVV